MILNKAAVERGLAHASIYKSEVRAIHLVLIFQGSSQSVVAPHPSLFSPPPSPFFGEFNLMWLQWNTRNVKNVLMYATPLPSSSYRSLYFKTKFVTFVFFVFSMQLIDLSKISAERGRPILRFG